MAFGLQMLYRVGDMFDSKVGIKFSKLLVYELLAIVGYDGVRHPTTTYNVFPNEMLNLLSYDSG